MKYPRRKVVASVQSVLDGRWIVTLSCGHREVVKQRHGKAPKTAGCFNCGCAREAW